AASAFARRSRSKSGVGERLTAKWSTTSKSVGSAEKSPCSRSTVSQRTPPASSCSRSAGWLKRAMPHTSLRWARSSATGRATCPVSPVTRIFRSCMDGDLLSEGRSGSFARRGRVRAIGGLHELFERLPEQLLKAPHVGDQLAARDDPEVEVIAVARDRDVESL